MARNTGRELQDIVATIEGILIPKGFSLETNRVEYSNGRPIAEFDVEVMGTVGTADLSWLIECRDRPSEGPAPGSWIEQLVSRRSRFGYSAVMAVSTTGFAEGAREYAVREGIDLREVQEVDEQSLSGWLLTSGMLVYEHVYSITDAQLILRGDGRTKERNVLSERLKNVNINEPILRASDTGAMVRASEVLATHAPTILEDQISQIATGESLDIAVRVDFPFDNSHFVVDTKDGAIRIDEILILGNVTKKEKFSEFNSRVHYKKLADKGKPISQSAMAVFDSFQGKFAVELHNIRSTGETHVVLRKIADNQ